MRAIIIYINLLVLFSTVAKVDAQKVNFSGQLAGWGTLNPTTSFDKQVGARYIPEITYIESYESNVNFEVNFSYNAYVNQTFWGTDSTDFSYDYKPYRFFVKYSTDQVELRGGLQKINFGSAQMLRPLMWFDKIDPRDPLQMTDGVFGGLARYYFLNNANIWFWVLIANDEPKGWEFFPSIGNKPEIGGRVQLPFLTGEIATTYHYRKANISGSPVDTLTAMTRFNENRLGLDFKLDYEIGLWFETAIIHQDVDFTKLKNKQLLTIGTDYTFPVGSGLTVKSEYFSYANNENIIAFNDNVSFGAISVNYPLSIIHSLSGILYYDFTNNDYYRFINWSLQYDKWSFYVMAFWNPEKFQIYQNISEAGLFAGKGFQLMAVFNH